MALSIKNLFNKIKDRKQTKEIKQCKSDHNRVKSVQENKSTERIQKINRKTKGSKVKLKSERDIIINNNINVSNVVNNYLVLSGNDDCNLNKDSDKNNKKRKNN
ncbi:MAG: hypothetical protein REH79_02485 [Spiroplasma sp.]|nr:hypothetical protein [Spiroplasma sp.]